MARADKPYRVYRGGRTRGKVPTLPRPERPRRRRGRRGAELPQQPPPPRRRRGWGRRIGLVLFVLVLVVTAWAVASYLAFRSGVAEANDRLDPETRAGLAPQDGLLLSESTVILLLGTDHANREDRATARRSDSIMLVRTDPRRNRLALLSIPRDLRADVPGHGPGKINSAFQLGGAPLALRTIRGFTGIPVNHIAVVDFGSFAELIDTLGGVEVDVPAAIVSNRFDCPYATEAQCTRWPGWRFTAGKQTMSGRRALVYSRVRENRLDPGESDITRGERQQEVLQAITRKLVSPRTLLRLPVAGDELLRPLATDLSAWQFVQLGWRRVRSSPSSTLRCRLGGEASTVGGQSFVVPTEENVSTIAMFMGLSAPQPPLPGSGPFGPGCVVGGRPGDR